MNKKLILFNFFINIFLPLVTILGVTEYFHYQRLKNQAKDNATFLNRFYSEKITDKINKTEFLLKTVSAVASTSNMDTKTIKEFIKNYLEIDKDYTTVGITNENGDVIISTLDPKDKVNLSDRSYFQEAKESLSLSASEILKGRITGKESVVFAYPIIDSEEKFKGVVFTGISLETLNQILESLYVPENASVMVLDKNGVILARKPENEKWRGKNIINQFEVARKAISEKKFGALIGRGIDNQEKVFAYQPIEYNSANSKIFIISGFSTDVIKEPVKQHLVIFSILFSLFFVILTVVNYLILKNLKKKGLLES